MCIAVPLEVQEVKGNIARVTIGEASREVCLDLLDEVKVGDFILVHAGFAIEKIDKEEAEKTLDLFRKIVDEVS
jgi:hydrogenase expression/formation protein HypC